LIKVLLLCTALLLVSLSGPGAAARTADTSANRQTQDTLLYLEQIANRSTHNVITGQYTATAACCSSQEIGAGGIAYNIEATIRQTRQTPGVVGFDYNDWNTSHHGQPVDYTTLNAFIIKYAKTGSLITIGYHANNPWTGGAWNDARCPGSFTDLVDPTKPVSAVWRAQVSKIADQLQILQAAGVTVMWRPFLEMNGNFMWWGACNPTQAQFRTVWKDMFNFFTTTRGLHNILWVYAQNGGTDTPVFYPGSDLFDVMGFDDYHDPITFPGIGNWMKYGKPLAYTERGPHETDGTSQVFTNILPTIAANEWHISFVQVWAGAYGIAYNPGGSAFMNDPTAANQQDVKAVMSCMAGVQTRPAKIACVREGGSKRNG
jgi:mannan endo-1,4-beta-mannosidase